MTSDDIEDILTLSMTTALSLCDLSLPVPVKPQEIKPCKVPSSFFRDGDGNSPWHRAVNKANCTLSDVVKLKKYLSIINRKNLLGHTVIHCAVINNAHKLEIIEFLIDNGADVCAKDYNNSTALHKALQNPKCTAALIDLLIDKGARLHVKQFMYETPFMYALKCRNRNADIISKLIYENCLDICENHRRSHVAIKVLVNDLVLTQMFLKYSFYLYNIDDSNEVIKEEDILEFSCFDSVCGFKYLEGVDSRCTDLSTGLLLFAVRYPKYNLAVVRELMMNGGDIYANNCRSRCALDYALSNPNCSASLIQEMLAREPCYTHKRKTVGSKHNTFLHLATLNRRNPADVIYLIIDKDDHEHVNTENVDGQTPLDMAADVARGRCNLGSVEMLLIHGAKTIRKDSFHTGVLWRNMQFLCGPEANDDALDCTKLLVKYALVENYIDEDFVEDAYAYVISLIAHCRARDRYGYVEKLTNYLNDCMNEIMIMKTRQLSGLSLFEATIRRHLYDLGPGNEELFWFIVSGLCPSYTNLLLRYLMKPFLANYLFYLKIYTTDSKGKNIHLNSYCIGYLSDYLNNITMFNLFLAFVDPNVVKTKQNEGQKWLHQLDKIDWDERKENLSAILPKKKYRVN